MAEKPKKVDIAAVEFLLADLDPGDRETPEAAKARYLKRLENFQPKPSAVIDLGNGIQVLWRLAEPIDLSCFPLGTDAEGKPTLGAEATKIVADVEARSATLMRRLGAKPGTQNIDRILRLPGTINLPTKAKRERGRVPCPTRLLGVQRCELPAGGSAF